MSSKMVFDQQWSFYKQSIEVGIALRFTRIGCDVSNLPLALFTDLESSIDKSPLSVASSRLVDSMQWLFASGGKRLRPVLFLTFYNAFLQEQADHFSEQEKEALNVLALDLAIALEFIHTYSLVHDDLPAMDNDTLRRGRPTVHTKFDEATAILAGDALLNEAHLLMLESLMKLPNRLKNRGIQAITFMSQKASARGMIAGQAMDLYTEEKAAELLEFELDTIQHLKTSALIEASILTPAILFSVSKERLDVLNSFARCLGLAFQLKDDLLDIFATEETLGKSIGKDIKSEKSTQCSVLGQERAIQKFEALSQEASSLIPKMHLISDFSLFLTELMMYLAQRNF